MVDYEGIWVFTGGKSGFPAGLFRDLEKAEAWIRDHGLSGTLTKYPVDVGLFAWAIDQGLFSPKKDFDRAAMAADFTCPSLDQHRYERGRRA